MREIKFRMWDKDNDVMYSWEQLYEIDKAGGILLVELLNGKYDNAEMLQYIGQCDVNGTEMYEGDVVQTCGYGRKPELATVVFNAGGFCFRFDAHHNSELFDDALVVGNIYENPELLRRN